MRIGVLTYIREYANLGTNMQSYCTFKAVQKCFPKAHVELIDYSGWKPHKRPYLSGVSAKSLYNDLVRIRKYDRFFKEHFTFSKKKLISSDLNESLDFIRQQRYDAIFVGSDTLLELKRAKPDELTAYWLDNTVKSKKYLIAASSHNVTFESLSRCQRKKMQATLDDYSLLGVRDEASYRLISHFVSESDQRLQIIPDPTFSHDIDYLYIEAYLNRKKINFEKPVVCLHMLRDNAWASELAGLFRRNGYLVASLRPAHYADYIFTDLSPFEQLGLYKYFSLVITHRFHDSIFSFKNLTPVIVFPEFSSDVTEHGENKNRTLFKSFNLEQNYLGDRNQVNAKYIFEMHMEAVERFKKNEMNTKRVLLENKKRYMSYVEFASTKLLEKGPIAV